MPTYEELIDDDDFVGSVYNVFSELGQDIPSDRQQLVDDFLTYRRAMEDNVAATFQTKAEADSLSDNGKIMLGYALEQAASLPILGAEGSAPVLDGVLDHVRFSLTDPFNLAAVALAPFTLGGSLVAGAGAKGGAEVAKQGIKYGLKQAVKKPLERAVATVKNPGARKILAAEGGINFTGTSVRENEIQNIEQEVGIRDKKDIGEIATIATAETILAPVVGIGGTVVAETFGRLVKAGIIDPALQKSPAADFYTNRIVNMFRPASGLDDDIVRKNEILAGIQNRAMRDGQDLVKNLEKNKTYKDLAKTKEGVDLLNQAVEGYSEALGKIRGMDDKLPDLLEQGRSYIRQAQEYGNQVSDLSPNYAKYFDPINPDFNPHWAKFIYEAYEGPRQVSFSKYKKQNPTLVDDIFELLKKDAALPDDQSQQFYKSFGLTPGQLQTGTLEGQIRNRIESGAEKMYKGQDTKYEEAASLLKGRKGEEELPELFSDLLGRNALPARRILASVQGIMEPMTRFHLANETGRILEKKGLAVLADSAEDAANKFAAKDGTIVSPSRLRTIHDEAIPVPGVKVNRVGGLRATTQNYYVSDKLADDMRLAFTNPNFSNVFKQTDEDIRAAGLQGAINFASTIQGASKLFKTAYSPVAMGRNILGAAIQVGATGNLRGLSKLKNDFWDNPENQRALRELGILDTGVTLRQILNRLGPEFAAYAAGRRGGLSSFRKILMAPISQGGFGLKFRDAYQKVDDMAKTAAYYGEKSKLSKHWQQYTPEKKDQLRDQMRTFLNKKNVTDDEVLTELAVRNALDVMPTYSRVPQITEALRGIPIIGNFMGYSAEVIRNNIKILRKGHEEMIEGLNTNNAGLARQGADRILRMAAVNAGFYAGSMAFTESEFSKEKMAALKSFVPDWDRNAPLLITGVERSRDPERRQSEDIKIQYKNIGWANPNQPVEQLVSAVLAAGLRKDEDFDTVIEENITPALLNLVSPFVDPSLALGFAGALWDMAHPEDDARFNRGIKKAIDIGTPGYLDLVKDLAIKAEKLPPEVRNVLDPRYFNEQREKFEGTPGAYIDFMSEVGFFLAPEKTFSIRGDMGFALSEVQKERRREHASTSQNFKSLFTDRSATDELNAEKIARDYEEAIRTQYAHQQNYGELIKDLETLTDNDRQYIRRLMKDPALSGAFPQSQKERNRMMENRSFVQRISNNADFWRDVRIKNPEFPTQKIRTMFREIEQYYDNQNLENDLDPALD